VYSARDEENDGPAIMTAPLASRFAGIETPLLKIAVAGFLALAGCGPTPPEPEGSSYLFVWSGDADEKDSDFLAVVDARAGEPTYGRVVATLPVGATGTMPHHMQYDFPANGLLFANGWKAGRTFVIDVDDPLAPVLAADFEGAAGYSYPHSFAPLPDGRVLATFQTEGGSRRPPGGLVELSPTGEAIRAVSSRTPEIDDELNWPYSLIVLPDIGRAVSTSSDMGFPPMDSWVFHDTFHVQVWDLDTLALVASVPLPPDPDGTHHLSPAEPRRLADGTVYVSTFACGLYRLDGLAGEHPSATFVHAFPGSLDEECSVPVVAGDYWVQTVPALPGLIALDVSDPRAPREAARLRLDAERYPVPHWLAADRESNRLVVTGSDKSWVLVVVLDEESGELSIDAAFREPGSSDPGIRFDRDDWPHGRTGRAWVHGALFGG